MTNFQFTEERDPSFNGYWRTSPVNGLAELYFNQSKRFKRQIISSFIILLLILCVIGIVTLIFSYYNTLVELHDQYGHISIINFCYTN